MSIIRAADSDFLILSFLLILSVNKASINKSFFHIPFSHFSLWIFILFYLVMVIFLFDVNNFGGKCSIQNLLNCILLPVIPALRQRIVGS